MTPNDFVPRPVRTRIDLRRSMPRWALFALSFAVIAAARCLSACGSGDIQGMIGGLGAASVGPGRFRAVTFADPLDERLLARSA